MPIKYLTAAEAADILRLKPATVSDMCRAGEITATRPTGRWLIAETDLQSFLDAASNREGESA